MFRSSTRSHAVRHRFLFVVAATVIAMGCSSTGGTGCAALAPLPGGAWYTGPKTDNAVNIRLSPNGINYINSHWQSLVDMFAPGRVLTLPFNCMSSTFTIPVIGTNLTAYIADQGNNSGTGRMDGACDANDLPANINVTIESFNLTTVPATGGVAVTLTLRINTPKIYVRVSALHCSVEFDTDRAPGPSGGSCFAPGSPANCNNIGATVTFTIDPKWDKLMSFQMATLTGTDICPTSGPPPGCIDPLDLALNSECPSGFSSCDVISWVCTAVDFDPIKQFILGQLNPLLRSQIQAQIAKQSCQSCGAVGDRVCPSVPAACTGAACTATSSCVNNTCMECPNAACTNPTKCVPRFLGVEGRVSMGAFLGNFGASADSMIDLSVAAGSTVVVDTGLTIGTRAGITPTTVSPCVVAAPAPQGPAMVPAPDFDREASPGSTYHAGVGISSAFLNTAFWGAQQAGALCLNLSTANVGLINSGLFKTFLPSLGKLATRTGSDGVVRDAPMMVVLRPGDPPTVSVGLGTFDPVTHKPLKPLLVIGLKNLSIDFYVQLDDRFARLFTLTADISLPLSLIFQGCDKVQPAIGDLTQVITNVRTANSEMLAEDPSVLADLIPAVIGLAQPALANGLAPFSLPPLGSFKLKVNEVKGIGNIPGTETYYHLGLFAQLMGAMDPCATVAPKLQASLKRAVVPKAAEMRLTGKPLPWPEAVLAVEASGTRGTPEFSYRVDDGMWTDFVLAQGGELPVSSPMFLMQGRHTIFVRTRMAEEPHGISPDVPVPFLVDWDPPELSFTVDRAADRLVLHARDVVTPEAKLELSYQVGQGAAESFGPAREISLSAVEAQGGLTVLARDEAGNVGKAQWRVPSVALRPLAGGAQAASALPAPATGCSTAGGLELLGLAALALLRRRR